MLQCREFADRYLVREQAHLENAERHSALGHPAEWAAKSRSKAAKWRKLYEDAATAEVEFNREHPEVAEIFAILSKGISDSFMFGSPEQSHRGLV